MNSKEELTHVVIRRWRCGPRLLANALTTTAVNLEEHRKHVSSQYSDRGAQ